jgi:energy-coupling factor transporter ATP-binding protein EcfA2
MKTLETLNAHSLRALLREYRNAHYAAASAAGLGDSATIGKYSTEELRQWCEKLEIDCDTIPATPAPISAPALTVKDCTRINPFPEESAGALLQRALEMLTPQAAPLDENAIRALVADEIEKAPARMDESAIRALVTSEVATAMPRTVRVEIVNADKVTKTEGQHYLFPLVVKLISAGVPVMLCGPAGSGKTTLAHNVARVLEKQFEFNSYGPGMSEAKLLGYKDAGGSYHSTALIRMAKAGGVYLADELDRADGAIVTTLNSLLANGQISTPEGCFEKHSEFVFIAGTNTAGTGANDLYTAAQEQDAALLDRLFFLSMPYDEALEERACGLSLTPQKEIAIDAGGVVTAEKWLLAVRAARQVCADRQMRHTISPRASIMGARLCAQSIGIDWLIAGLLTRGLPADEAQAIESAARAILA